MMISSIANGMCFSPPLGGIPPFTPGKRSLRRSPEFALLAPELGRRRLAREVLGGDRRPVCPRPQVGKRDEDQALLAAHQERGGRQRLPLHRLIVGASR